jgi:hypothetical protein
MGLRRRPDITTAPFIDGSTVLYDPRASAAYALNASAALVWTALDGSGARDAIVSRLADVYDASADVIARDTDACLAHLASLGLLEPIRDANADRDASA